MTKRIKISELPEFDVIEYLNSEEDIAAYLTTVIEENAPTLLATAIGDVDRARGFMEQPMRLSLADQECFAQTLLSPPKPAPALERAFARCSRLLRTE